MPLFRYRGRNGRGELVEGELEAALPDAVANQLINTGITPIDIRVTAVGNDIVRQLQVALTTRKVELTDLILFCRQMYTLMRAGVPIIQAMTGLSRSIRHPVLVETLKDMQANLESGRTLSAAMARHPRVFLPLIVNMVRVGENTGKLEEALQQLAVYLDHEKDTRDRIKAALRYPSFVILAIAVAVGVINVMVIPGFAKIFAKAKVELPLPTRALMISSDFFVNFWPLLLVGSVIAFFAVKLYSRTERGRYLLDKWKLRIPVTGSIVERATLGRFARSFAMCLSAGVPLSQALTVVAKTLDNEFLGGRILDMRNGIERGETITRTAAATGMFTPLVLQMLTVGEETGAVDELMLEVADFYDREVDYDVKNLSAAIEPILLIFVGAMVLVLALGVFLPMWDLASVQLGK